MDRHLAAGTIALVDVQVPGRLQPAGAQQQPLGQAGDGDHGIDRLECSGNAGIGLAGHPDDAGTGVLAAGQAGDGFGGADVAQMLD